MTEARIQQEICVYYRNTYCLRHHVPRSLLMSIPNEGKPHLVQTGLYAGGADLLLLHIAVGKAGTRVRVIFIEVKTPTGVVSTKQKKFKNHIKAMGAIINDNLVSLEYHLVRSLAEFKKVINNG